MLMTERLVRRDRHYPTDGSAKGDEMNTTARRLCGNLATPGSGLRWWAVWLSVAVPLDVVAVVATWGHITRPWAALLVGLLVGGLIGMAGCAVACADQRGLFRRTPQRRDSQTGVAQ